MVTARPHGVHHQQELSPSILTTGSALSTSLICLVTPSHCPQLPNPETMQRHKVSASFSPLFSIKIVPLNLTILLSQKKMSVLREYLTVSKYILSKPHVLGLPAGTMFSKVLSFEKSQQS